MSSLLEQLSTPDCACASQPWSVFFGLFHVLFLGRMCHYPKLLVLWSKPAWLALVIPWWTGEEEMHSRCSWLRMRRTVPAFRLGEASRPTCCAAGAPDYGSSAPSALSVRPGSSCRRCFPLSHLFASTSYSQLPSSDPRRRWICLGLSSYCCAFWTKHSRRVGLAALTSQVLPLCGQCAPGHRRKAVPGAAHRQGLSRQASLSGARCVPQQRAVSGFPRGTRALGLSEGLDSKDCQFCGLYGLCHNCSWPMNCVGSKCGSTYTLLLYNTVL